MTLDVVSTPPCAQPPRIRAYVLALLAQVRPQEHDKAPTLKTIRVCHI